MAESNIQKLVIDYLRFKKIFVFKINNVGIKKPNGSYIPSQTKGLPDLVVHYKGKVIYLEIKTKIGRLSENQKQFKEQCEKDGIEYYVIRSIEDLLKVL